MPAESVRCRKAFISGSSVSRSISSRKTRSSSSSPSDSSSRNCHSFSFVSRPGRDSCAHPLRSSASNSDSSSDPAKPVRFISRSSAASVRGPFCQSVLSDSATSCRACRILLTSSEVSSIWRLFIDFLNSSSEKRASAAADSRFPRSDSPCFRRASMIRSALSHSFSTLRRSGSLTPNSTRIFMVTGRLCHIQTRTFQTTSVAIVETSSIFSRFRTSSFCTSSASCRKWSSSVASVYSRVTRDSWISTVSRPISSAGAAAQENRTIPASTAASRRFIPVMKQDVLLLLFLSKYISSRGSFQCPGKRRAARDPCRQDTETAGAFRPGS